MDRCNLMLFIDFISYGITPLLSDVPPKMPRLERERNRRVHWSSLLGVSGSSGFGWLGILLSRLNFPEFVASPSGFKALRRLFGIVTYRPGSMSRRQS